MINKSRRKVKEWIETLKLTKVEKKRLLLIGISSVVLAILLQFMDNRPLGESVQRNTYGNGDRNETMQIQVEPACSGNDKLKIDLQIQEQKYTSQELEKIIEEIESQIDMLVLGENKIPEHITKPLHLITQVEPYPLEIQWSWTPYEGINQEGEIQQKSIKDGEILELLALITYGEEEFQYRKCVSLYKTKPTEIEQLLSNIKEKVEGEDPTQPEVVLPKKVDGIRLRWNAPRSYRGLGVGIVGLVIVGLLIAKKQQDKQLLQKKNQEAILSDYPIVISNMGLYIGAGMSVKNTWESILQEAKKNNVAEVGVYPEMKRTWHEIRNGQPEAECYERFGKRCGTRGYQRMGLLLSQNLKRGTKGILEQLEKESIEAFEERKNRAKQKGEQASTKLLLPMGLMLMVVLVIVIVPAFLSLQL